MTVPAAALSALLSPPAPFGFSPVFGDYMVLQQGPAAAAVYGPAPTGATAVSVTVGGTMSYEVAAVVGKGATHQPVGYVDPSGQPLPALANSWKAVLKPAAAGGDFTVTARCTKGCGDNATAVKIAHVTFGDVWYCSGQSNMWLPVEYSFSRNETVAAIGKGKYGSVRGMFSPSGTTPTAGQWKTAQQAVADGNVTHPTYSLFAMGATCWYFAESLVDRGLTTPIGIVDTAIGGQRIEEFMNNGTYAGAARCPDAVGGAEVRTVWNGQLFAKQVMPFVDMTVKGWLWYQGENNMMNVKGNALLNLGYSCKQRELVKGWRAIWSEVAGTTAADAPFGIVTLASSGSEGGPNMGAMRLAQTAGVGVLPNSQIPNAFFAQAGDLEDVWGPAAGPCFSGTTAQWNCCPNGAYAANRSSPTCVKGTGGNPGLCDPACAAAAGTPSKGGIHPRTKRAVGQRLAAGAFNLVYGGKGAQTGPTLSSCVVQGDLLTINFNATLLAGDKVQLNSYNASLNNEVAKPPAVPEALEPCFEAVKSLCGGNLHNVTDCRNCKNLPGVWDKLKPVCGGRPINNFHVSCKCFFPEKLPLRGSLTQVLVAEQGAADGAAAFCIEPQSSGDCPTWAGGGSAPYNASAGRWLTVDLSAATATSITIDLSALNGSTPLGVRHAWGIFDCCNTGDELLYVSKPCDAPCPITSTALLPANPFMAKIVAGRCECVAPQQCGA